MTDQNMNQNPYGPYANNPNPNAGQNPESDDGNQYSFNPFRLVEEMLPQRAKNTIRGAYGLIGIVAVILGVALLVWPGKTLLVATHRPAPLDLAERLIILDRGKIVADGPRAEVLNAVGRGQIRRQPAMEVAS